jgi:hypothetical protein
MSKKQFAFDSSLLKKDFISANLLKVFSSDISNAMIEYLFFCDEEPE